MAMEMRVFGRTGMQLSVLGFGCGAVGGLMVRGDPRDQESTIARALAVGVNYFDTAVQYGNGESEKNLGSALQQLKPANVVVGTKVRLPASDFGCIADAVAKSLEASLARLRRDRIDIFHLHNAITETGGGQALSVRQVLGDVVPAFGKLRQQGKARYLDARFSERDPIGSFGARLRFYREACGSYERARGEPGLQEFASGAVRHVGPLIGPSYH